MPSAMRVAVRCLSFIGYQNYPKEAISPGDVVEKGQNHHGEHSGNAKA